MQRCEGEMVEETTRGLTREERSVLEGLRRPATSGGARFGGLITFLVTLGALLTVTPASWRYGVRSLAPVAVALLLGVGVFYHLRRRQRADVWYRRAEQDLEGGVATVTTYHVVDAINVEESEDEGSQYYLLLDDGRVLFLSGQYLYEAEEEERFPNARITVVRTPATATVLDLRCEGASLSVSTRLQPFTASDHREGRVPDDGALLDVSFESLRAGR
jgi:hypothetical protein